MTELVTREEAVGIHGIDIPPMAAG